MQLTATRLAKAQNPTLGESTVCQINGDSGRGNHVLSSQVPGETVPPLGADGELWVPGRETHKQGVKKHIRVLSNSLPHV